MEKIVACIPIKMNSTRLPGKNIMPFYDGTPLMTLIQQHLLEVDRISEVYVFCSSEEVRKYLLPGVRFLKRNEYLDSDEATPQMIMSEFMEAVGADIYAFCHATSPFVTSASLNRCIDGILEKDCDSAFTAHKMNKLLWMDGKPLNFDATQIPRTQDLPPLYEEVSAAYFFRRAVMTELHRRIGNHPFICELDPIESIDIDDKTDFLIADLLYRHQKENGNG